MATIHHLHIPSDVENQTPDYAGITGLILGALAGINLIMGMGIPLIPWVVSGTLVIPLLVLGAFAKRPLRRFVLIMGFLSMIPPLVLGCVELMPRILGPR